MNKDQKPNIKMGKSYEYIIHHYVRRKGCEGEKALDLMYCKQSYQGHQLLFLLKDKYQQAARAFNIRLF